MKVIYFSIIILLLTIYPVKTSLMFEMEIDRPRCFLEELFQGSIMLANYRIVGINDTDQEKISRFLSWISIQIISEKSGDILKREYLKEAKGKISFHATEGGHYKICVGYHGGWTFPYQTMVVLKINSDNMDEPDLSKAIKVNDTEAIHEKARTILNMGQQIVYRQVNETEFEDTTAVRHIAITKYYYNMTVFQVLVVLILGVYQVFSFRKFLVNNNVI